MTGQLKIKGAIMTNFELLRKRLYIKMKTVIRALSDLTSL